jgi:hypothetical protein
MGPLGELRSKFGLSDRSSLLRVVEGVSLPDQPRDHCCIVRPSSLRKLLRAPVAFTVSPPASSRVNTEFRRIGFRTAVKERTGRDESPKIHFAAYAVMPIPGIEVSCHAD